MEELYTAVVTARGGRDGYIRSTDGAIDIKLKMPTAMGGAEDGHLNPELLFAGAWASCYLHELNLIGKKDGADMSDATVDVFISFNSEGESGFELSAKLHVYIPGINQKRANRLAEAAHHACVYSKVTRFNIDVKIIVNESIGEQQLASAS